MPASPIEKTGSAIRVRIRRDRLVRTERRHRSARMHDKGGASDGLALTSTVERTRVEALTLLDGVQWPTASVILHFYHKDPYPIIDFRTLWSISMEVPSHYSFEFWWQYVEYCRLLAKRAHLEMRALDQALWQYSKENQVSV